MKNKRLLIIISAASIALIILLIVILSTNNGENHDGTEFDKAYIDEMLNSGHPIAEYDFMGGRCVIFPREENEYIALAVFDIDISNDRVVSVSYGQQDISADTYYEQYQAESKGGLVYSADDRAYVYEWGQLYTTVSAPLYSQSVYGLSIDGSDACAWIMSKDQFRTLEEASSITFLCAESCMSVVLE